MSESKIDATGTALRHLALHFIPGFVLTVILTTIATYLSQIPWFTNLGLSVLTIAILLGIIVGNTLYPSLKSTCGKGIHFAKHYLLRAGIILYGFRLTFQQITDVGVTGILIDVIMLSSTFFIALWLGHVFFRMDSQTVMLIGAGSSICGAAAVMATETVVKASSDNVAVAISTVVIFGTLAIFIYPWFYQINIQHQWFSFSQTEFGMFSGSTIHEVAQVVAVGHTQGNDAENTAVISKMIRVMMLAPFLLLLSGYISRTEAKNCANDHGKASITIPWFAVFFIVTAGFNSLQLLPASIVSYIIIVDTIMLTMAMVALGLTTHVSAIRQAGTKPILLAFLLFIWLMVGGLIINKSIHHLFG
ncbi:YeiH family putative sulfate export transporter [Xenorhabdus budapestensis]|uniref:YeiH family putative sulfate export transporter n=1 Tax=Xenorhabdus budapestensis TaxID=290110 RepID=A0ABX7VKH8_XENBU|nr:YeiH family protein [Xenorhabdus budapestensis]QTL41276.1 YeiH family putative sulfate export transporter [Xenorhabdus budapestensis]